MASSSCTVCGTWYDGVGISRYDVCTDCWRHNFAGALDLHAPSAREALEAYVSTPPPLTPRQVQALARMHAYWQRRQAGEDAHA